MEKEEPPVEEVREWEIKEDFCRVIRRIRKCTCSLIYKIPYEWCCDVKELYDIFLLYRHSKIKPALTEEQKRLLDLKYGVQR